MLERRAGDKEKREGELPSGGEGRPGLHSVMSRRRGEWERPGLQSVRSRRRGEWGRPFAPHTSSLWDRYT